MNNHWHHTIYIIHRPIQSNIAKESAIFVHTINYSLSDKSVGGAADW